MKKICVFTGTRSEYGLLFPLLKAIEEDAELQLQLLVSGMHLSEEFGCTYRLIEADGFRIDAKVPILDDEDSALGTCRSISRGITGYAEVLLNLKPDLLVLLGDRSEAFAAATAALVCHLPIAHLHGGETTEGAYDEAFRHSITKMSQLHFVSTESYRQRVIQLGENPQYVHNVGAIGLEHLEMENLLDRNALEQSLGYKFGKRNAMVTFHPVTLEKGAATEQFNQLLAAVDQLEDVKLVFTKANADTEGRTINQLIDAYVAKHPDRAIAFTSMGHLRYLSTMRIVDLVVGNSSSGIIEAPSFGVPTINIGDRQKGRIKAASVIDCEPEEQAILSACREALSDPFQKMAPEIENPYQKKGTARKIMQIIKSLDTISLKKTFYDILAEGPERQP